MKRLSRNHWARHGNGHICVALGVLILALCVHAEAQQPAKIPKIGFLNAGFGSASGIPWREPLQRELQKLGYIDGKNVAFIYRYADTKYDRLPVLAQELVRLKVDLIITPGANDTRAAKNATQTIPIVFTGAGSDPVTLGLVDSLARPGRNVTGFAQIASTLAGKKLELLKETVPKLSRVAVLWDPQNAGSVQIWEESQRRAKELGIVLYALKINGADTFESGLKQAVKAGSGALLGTSGALIGSLRTQIINLATKNRLPAIYPRAIWVVNGGLMSYGPDEIEPFQQSARMVDKILKGANPADLPVEQPTKFDLIINLKTAKQIGLTIPQIVLARADRVIK